MEGRHVRHVDEDVSQWMSMLSHGDKTIKKKGKVEGKVTRGWPRGSPGPRPLWRRSIRSSRQKRSPFTVPKKLPEPRLPGRLGDQQQTFLQEHKLWVASVESLLQSWAMPRPPSAPPVPSTCGSSRLAELAAVEQWDPWP